MDMSQKSAQPNFQYKTWKKEKSFFPKKIPWSNYVRQGNFFLRNVHI